MQPEHGSRDLQALRIGRRTGASPPGASPPERQVSAVSLSGIREDEPRLRVPWGFGKYVVPQVNPADYRVVWAGAWRIQVPRALCPQMQRDLINRIYNYGPQAAGYVQVADVLVPAALGPGARQALAGVASAPGAPGALSWGAAAAGPGPAALEAADTFSVDDVYNSARGVRTRAQAGHRGPAGSTSQGQLSLRHVVADVDHGLPRAQQYQVHDPRNPRAVARGVPPSWAYAAQDAGRGGRAQKWDQESDVRRTNGPRR